MTCIVGLIDKKTGITYMGGDSLGSNGYSGNINKNRKVFHSKDTSNAVMGYTSTFRMGQVLQFSKGLFDELTVSKNGIDDEYLVNTFIPKLQTLFNNSGIEKNTSGIKSGGSFLLGYKECLYEIQSDYSVLESSNDYNSCGSGEAFAFGSLYTTEKMDLTPIERIHMALQSASKFAVGVSAPFYIINTDNDEVIELLD